MAINLAKFHKFITGEFRERVQSAYRRNLILSEADLQAYAWYRIRRYLRKHDLSENDTVFSTNFALFGNRTTRRGFQT